MRSLEQLEMHRRKRGKGSGTDTFDIRFGQSRHAPNRIITVHVTQENGWNKLRVSVNINRKPNTEELERIRSLFFWPHEDCLHFVHQPNRYEYADLWQPPSPIDLP